MPLPPRLRRRLGRSLSLGHQLDGLVDRGDGVEARGGVAGDDGCEQDEGVGRVLLTEGVGLGGRLEQGGGWRGVQGQAVGVSLGLVVL